MGWPCLYFALCSCSAYDPSLLLSPDVAAPLPIPDAGGTGGHIADAGPVDSGVKPMARCGDGLLNGDEKCDVAIAADKPGACPTECAPAAECAPRAVSGAQCNAECVVLQPTCKTGDGCCSGNCTTDNDGDCSSSCGDGIVQGDKGETCDPGIDDSDAGGGGKPCKTLADCDDGLRCTMDVLLGSAQNCNTDCSHIDIVEPKNGDGCCPPNADANADNDCEANCGNTIKEGTEECDGSLGCSNECKLTLKPEQISCLMMLPENANDCDKCSCMQCAKQHNLCIASGDASRDAHCAEVLACSNQHDCVRTACYCADPNDLFACGLGAAGPCRTEIDNAATAEGTGASPTAQTDDTKTAIGRAVATTDCNAMGCSDKCP